MALSTCTDKVQRMPWVAKEKLTIDINGEAVQVDKAMYAQLYKMDKETGIIERDPFNVPIRRISEGALMKKQDGQGNRYYRARPLQRTDTEDFGGRAHEEERWTRKPVLSSATPSTYRYGGFRRAR